MGGRIGSVAVAIAAGTLPAAPAARAGTYDVNACATPTGVYTNHSWQLAVNGSFASGSCSETDSRPQIAVSAEADQLYDAGRSATITFSAPPGATIANFRIQRQLYEFNPTDGSPDRQQLYTLGQLGTTPFEGGGVYDGGVTSQLSGMGNWYGGGGAYDTGAPVVTRDSFPALTGYQGNATTLRYTIGCHTTPCALKTNGAGTRGAIFAALFGATVTVKDPTPPRVTKIHPTGLAAPGPVAGYEPLTFDATDNTGIRRAELLDVTPGADSRVVGSEDYDSRCDYSRPTPCAQLESEEIPGAPSGFGRHELVIRLTDGAGNVGLSDPFSVQIDGSLNGSPASADAKLHAAFRSNHRRRLTVAYGHGASIRGSLTDAAGTPIAGAVVQVLERPRRTGGSYVHRPVTGTVFNGHFVVKLPPGPARAIRLEYRARSGQLAPTARATLSLRVRAGVTLSIRPHRVRPGHSIRLSGRLKGRPLPRSGKVVDLQAFDGGEWRTFATVRAGRSGRYVAHYRFRGSGGRTFAFRARVRRDDSYPYYLGYSPRVRVRVG